MTSHQDNIKTVLVTGFGPFEGHPVNASWVAVKELSKRTLPGVNLIIHELPVVYDLVKNKVPQLWKEHKPGLVIHVGVSKEAKAITLEQQAHNDGYSRLDINKVCPTDQCCVEGADNCLVSGINMELVCNDVNDSDSGVQTVVSHDPGRYLCDFSYFTSLHQDRSRSAFVHVPPLDQPYTDKQLADGLQQIILSMLKQL